MDALLLPTIAFALLALVALAAGVESRDDFDRSDPGRSIGR